MMNTVKPKFARHTQVRVPVTFVPKVREYRQRMIEFVLKNDHTYQANLRALEKNKQVEPWKAEAIRQWMRTDCLRRHGQSTGEWL